jgi:hypothetical protein
MVVPMGAGRGQRDKLDICSLDFCKNIEINKRGNTPNINTKIKIIYEYGAIYISVQRANNLG